MARRRIVAANIALRIPLSLAILAADAPESGLKARNREQAMSRRDELVAEVMAVLHKYQQAIETGSRDDIQTMVHLPVAYITEDDVQMRERYPFDPEKLRQVTGFHHGDSAYNVLHIDETKAHVVIDATRMRADNSPIEAVGAFYILQKRGDDWKIAAFSGIRTPA